MDVKITAVEVIVSNIERSLKWYKEKLNAKIVAEWKDWKCFDLQIGGNKIFLELGQPIKALGKEEYTREMKMLGKPTGIIFEVKNLDKTYKDLKDKGVDFLLPPHKAVFGAKLAVFKDIDGNEFKIFEQE
jgi:glyoxylase I family protein